MRTVAIVGAGTAGCVVARRLVDVCGDGLDTPRIVVIERGGLNPHHDDADFMTSLTSDAVTHVDATVTTDKAREHYLYVQGRCVGGGGAVNGMVASPLYEEDFAEWRDVYGCSDWDPQKLLTCADDLFPVTQISDDNVGVVGRAVISAGGRGAHLTRSGHRVSGATVIAQAVASGAVEIITADATRVVIEDNVVRSVATSSGEVPVDVVILTAGAVFTPLLLRQSGVVHGEIGQRAQDHPSIFFTVARPRDFVGGVNATAVHSMGDTQLIAYESAHPSTPMFGGVSLSMLRVTSRGEVSGTLQSPQLQLRLLSNDNDRALMRSAVRDFVREYVPVIERECGSVLCDALGTPAQHLATLNDPSLDAWLLAHVVPHSHIAGTCAMGGGPGAPVTQRGEVQGVRGLYVADASVFPQLPRSNTNKVVAAVASQIAHFVAEDLS